MRKPIKIGLKEYKFKKDAVAHYRNILNSYGFGQSLNEPDFNDLIDLLNYDYFTCLVENENSEESNEVENYNSTNDAVKIKEEGLSIEDIKVAKVQFDTKCFEVFYTDKTSQYISYLMMIKNKQYNPERLFYVACRNSIHKDIHSVKQEYFDKNSVKGQVKCQETSILSFWTELAVDHRQPNTFSIIVDRFKEVNCIDLGDIEYTSNEQNHIVFKDERLTLDFKKYHKEKANLRVVRKECNSSRTGMARIKKTTKDLFVK
jgi:hypothetical protein